MKQGEADANPTSKGRPPFLSPQSIDQLTAIALKADKAGKSKEIKRCQNPSQHAIIVPQSSNTRSFEDEAQALHLAEIIQRGGIPSARDTVAPGERTMSKLRLAVTKRSYETQLQQPITCRGQRTSI